MADSPNLVLPYLAANQSQKHVTVNEALRRLDTLVQITVQSAALAAPYFSTARRLGFTIFFMQIPCLAGGHPAGFLPLPSAAHCIRSSCPCLAQHAKASPEPLIREIYAVNDCI